MDEKTLTGEKEGGKERKSTRKPTGSRWTPGRKLPDPDGEKPDPVNGTEELPVDPRQDIDESTGTAGTVETPIEGKTDGDQEPDSGPATSPPLGRKSRKKSSHPGSGNLIPFSERSPEDVKKCGAKGGKKSGETRRMHKQAREIALSVMSLPANLDVKTAAQLAQNGIEDPTFSYMITYIMAMKAIEGDVAAARYLIDILREDPQSCIARERQELEREKLKLEQDWNQKKMEYDRERDRIRLELDQKRDQERKKLNQKRLKLEQERLELERERLAFERERYAMDHPSLDVDAVNEQILSLADLINNPVEERTFEEIYNAGREMAADNPVPDEDGDHA